MLQGGTDRSPKYWLFEDGTPTVVGVPGRIVARDGVKVENNFTDVDLDHNLLPDPVSDMLAAMQSRIDELEKRLESNQKEAPVDENIQHSKWQKRRAGNS